LPGVFETQTCPAKHAPGQSGWGGVGLVAIAESAPDSARSRAMLWLSG